MIVGDDFWVHKQDRFVGDPPIQNKFSNFLQRALKIAAQSSDITSDGKSPKPETIRMLDTPVLNLVSRALDYASTRQDVLANNIANANTPGFRRKDASFEDVLAMAQGGSAARISQIKNNARHMFGSGDNATSDVEIVETNDGAMRVDGNNVDMDAEMSRLAQNQIYYQALGQIASGQFSSLKYVISGGSGG
jgi:flagellar basal-body rod protein FlgB